MHDLKNREKRKKNFKGKPAKLSCQTVFQNLCRAAVFRLFQLFTDLIHCPTVLQKDHHCAAAKEILRGLPTGATHFCGYEVLEWHTSIAPFLIPLTPCINISVCSAVSLALHIALHPWKKGNIYARMWFIGDIFACITTVSSELVNEPTELAVCCSILKYFLFKSFIIKRGGK